MARVALGLWPLRGNRLRRSGVVAQAAPRAARPHRERLLGRHVDHGARGRRRGQGAVHRSAGSTTRAASSGSGRTSAWASSSIVKWAAPRRRGPGVHCLVLPGRTRTGRDRRAGARRHLLVVPSCCTASYACSWIPSAPSRSDMEPSVMPPCGDRARNSLSTLVPASSAARCPPRPVGSSRRRGSGYPSACAPPISFSAASTPAAAPPSAPCPAATSPAVAATSEHDANRAPAAAARRRSRAQLRRLRALARRGRQPPAHRRRGDPPTGGRSDRASSASPAPWVSCRCS